MFPMIGTPLTVTDVVTCRGRFTVNRDRHARFIFHNKKKLSSGFHSKTILTLASHLSSESNTEITLHQLLIDFTTEVIIISYCLFTYMKIYFHKYQGLILLQPVSYRNLPTVCLLVIKLVS
jgi:hypothetical protein